MDPQHRAHHDQDRPADLGGLIRRAYATTVDMDTAARHLWMLHSTAARLRRSRLRHTVVAACVSLMLVSTSGVAVAMSGTALPGDALYHVKRGTERVHLLMARAPESDARLHLKFARARLNEAVAVATARPLVLPTLFDEVASAMERAAAVGGPVVADEVHAVRAEASEAITSLAPGLDPEVALELELIAQRLGAVAVAVETGAEDDPAGDEQASAGDAETESQAADQPAQPARPPRQQTAAAPAPTPTPLPDPTPDEDEPEDAEDETADEERDSGREAAPDEEREVAGRPQPEEPAAEEPQPAPDEGGDPEGKRRPGVRELGAMLSERGSGDGHGEDDPGERHDDAAAAESSGEDGDGTLADDEEATARG